MKKIFLLMGALAATAMIATSCSKDDNNDPKEYVGLNAVYDKSTGSKYLKTSWSTGDNFSVYAGAQQNLKFDPVTVATVPAPMAPDVPVTSTALKTAAGVEDVIVSEGANKIYLMCPYNANAGNDPKAMAVTASDVQHFPVSGQKAGDQAYTFSTGFAEFASGDYVKDEKWDITVKPYFTNCSWPVTFDASGAITAFKVTADKPITMSATGKVNAETRVLSGTSMTMTCEMPTGGYQVEADPDWGGSKTVHFVILKQAVTDGVKFTLDITYGGKDYQFTNIELTEPITGMETYKPKNSIDVVTID